MKEITYKTHQKILGAVMIAYSAMNIFGALSILAAFNFISVFLDEPDMSHLFSFFSRLIGIALLLISIPALISGIGMLKDKIWSKNLTLISGILYLVFIPIGTIVGIYAIWLNSQNIIHEKEPVYATDLVKHSH